MHLGICQWSLPIPGPACCEFARDAGLDGVALEYTDSLLEQCPAYRDASKRFNVFFPALALNIFCNVSFTSGKNDEIYFAEIVKRALFIAHILNIPILQIPSFGASAIKTEDHLKRTAVCLRKACELAEGTDVQIGSENILRESDVHHLFALVDHPRLTYYSDGQNFVRMEGRDPLPVLRAMQHHTVQAHIKDYRLYPPPARYAALGQGDTNCLETLEQFARTACLNWLILENNYSAPLYGASHTDALSMVKADLAFIHSVFQPFS